MQSKAKLRIVGTGPGDPELLTLRAVNAIGNADVVLYDDQINPEIRMLYRGRQSRWLKIGDRTGMKRYGPEMVHLLILYFSTRFENIVLLERGDPLSGGNLEGTGSFTKYPISVEIVQGISPAIASPSAAGIPLTRRGVNESFCVVTGSAVTPDTYLAARSSATVVVMTDTRDPREVVAVFSAIRGEDEPAAIIPQSSWRYPEVVKGTAKNILDRFPRNRPPFPCILIFGKVIDESALMELCHRESDYLHK